MAKVARVAVVQDCPVPFDLGATVAKVEQLTAKVAETEARLIVFPEAFVSAYPRFWCARWLAQPKWARHVSAIF